MKVTNVVIHLANGILIYLVASLLLAAYRRQHRPGLTTLQLQSTALALVAGWLLLPINLTPVLYVVQRMTSLSGTFVLAGIALYLWGRLRMLQGRQGLWLLWVGMVVCGPLAVLAKESGALLPVYALVIEWTLFGFARADGRRDSRLLLLYALTLVLPGLCGLLWLAPHLFSPTAFANRSFTLTERLLTEPRVLLQYIVWTLLPNLRSLSFYHDDFPVSRGLLTPFTTVPAILAVVALLALALWQRRRRPLLSLGILWFFGGQLLTATIFNLELVFEHRNYLPDFGLLVAVFSIVLLEPPVVRLATARRFLVIGLIALYALITTLRVQQWANPLRFALIAATEHPHSPRATYALGRAYEIRVDGPHSPFFPLASQALEQAAGTPGASILPEQALLMMNAQQHQPLQARWWKSIEKKLAAHPVTPQDLQALGSLVDCQMHGGCHFPVADMLRVFGSALDKNPNNPDVLAIYANYAFNILHDYRLTRRLMLDSLALAPRTPQYWINLAKLDIFLDRFDDVHNELDRLRQLNHLGSLDLTLHALEQRLAQARTVFDKVRAQAPQSALGLQ